MQRLGSDPIGDYFSPEAEKGNVIVHSLDKQLILVIGGTSGIGLATAAAAVDAGAAATIASRNRKKLDAVAAKLRGAVQTRVLDTGDNDLLERFFQKERAWDHVLVSAAQTKTGPVRGMARHGKQVLGRLSG